MAKRKSAGDSPLPCKKAKLHHRVIHGGQISDAHTLHSPYSPPLSLTSPERREKRNRTPDSQSDTSEEPEIKRARRSISLESPDIGLKPWPSIEDKPRIEKKPCLWRQFVKEQNILAMQVHEEYDSDISADNENPLPDPEPSDGDTTGNNDWGFPTVDTSEESETEQAQRSTSLESPDTGSEPWPSIEDKPRIEKKPCQWRQFVKEQHILAMQVHEEYDSDISADNQNPLPSPEPSDGDATENNDWEFPTVDPIQLRHSAPEFSTRKTSRLLSRRRLRKQDPIPPQRKRRQPPKKGKDENKRNKPSGEALSPAVETFLRSKRSSRRDSNCKLWQLGDDGTAYAVSRVR